MCHQTVEKLLKAYWQSIKKQTPPKTRNLSYLAQETQLSSLFSDQQTDLLDELEPLNIETRYPSYREELANKLTKNYSIILLKNTMDFCKWTKKKL